MRNQNKSCNALLRIWTTTAEPRIATLSRNASKKNRDHPRAITQGIEIWLLGQCDTSLGWEVDSCMYYLESLFNTWTEWNSNSSRFVQNHVLCSIEIVFATNENIFTIRCQVQQRDKIVQKHFGVYIISMVYLMNFNCWSTSYSYQIGG